MTDLATIRQFLAYKRLAMVGVSKQAKDFSRTLFAELKQQGYDVVPVNPVVTDIDGQRCYAHVQDIQPPVPAALLMTTPAITDAVVRDCAEAGVRTVWMYRAGGTGAVSPAAIEFCQSKGLAVIPGECPYMFLRGTGWFHRVHGWIRQITGTYPA
jgi:predicted CoA-binding protein